MCICAKLLQATRNANSSLSSSLLTVIDSGLRTHLSAFLTAPGLYLMPTVLFCCPLSTAPLRHLSPTPLSPSLFLTPTLAFPCPRPARRRSRAQAFVWFRAKTDKGIICLADHPHSFTVVPIRILSVGQIEQFIIYYTWNHLTACKLIITWGYPRIVMVTVVECRIVVSEFELQSDKFYWERYETFILLVMG